MNYYFLKFLLWLHQKPWWKYVAKALGDKEYEDNLDADKVALIRFFIAFINLATCIIIVAGIIHKW